MIQVCCICHKLIHEGDRVKLMVEATYHTVSSTKTFALSKGDLEADSSTIQHVNCNNE